MAQTWPGSLPTKFLENSYKETPPDNAIAQPMDVGPPKRRKATTAGLRLISGRMYMTIAQVATFDTFFGTTCGSGALSFDGLNNQRTGSVVDHVFMGQPQYSLAGPDGYYVDLRLGEKP